jgi:selenocysteine lyase/cysteine desulfurase
MVEIRQQFPVTRSIIYLDHAAAGPISVPVRDAMCAFIEDHLQHGRSGVQAWRAHYESVRQDAARLVNGQPEWVTFVQNTSFGIAIATHGIEWREGDNVVVPQSEFPSNFYPWANLAKRGVEVRLVPAPGGHAGLDAIASAMDQRTRALSVSQVQYSNGFRYDLTALAQLCREHDSLFIVDGTQGVGALKIDVDRCGIDLLAVNAYKWMLGPRGIGFVQMSDRAMNEMSPSIVGWLSVREPFRFDYRLDYSPTATRFEPGTENAAGIYGLGAALRLIQEIGMDWIEHRVLALTDQLCEGLAARGCRVVSPRDNPSRSGIVVFTHERYPTEHLYRRLSEARVLCSARGGGIRLAPHFYNTEEEIEATLAVIAAA